MADTLHTDSLWPTRLGYPSPLKVLLLLLLISVYTLLVWRTSCVTPLPQHVLTAECLFLTCDILQLFLMRVRSMMWIRMELLLSIKRPVVLQSRIMPTVLSAILIYQSRLPIHVFKFFAVIVVVIPLTSQSCPTGVCPGFQLPLILLDLMVVGVSLIGLSSGPALHVIRLQLPLTLLPLGHIQHVHPVIVF